MRLFIKFLYALGEHTQRGARYGDGRYVGELYSALAIWQALYGGILTAERIASPAVRASLIEPVINKVPLDYVVAGGLALAITGLCLVRNREKIISEFRWIPLASTPRVRLAATAACFLLALLLGAVAQYFTIASIPFSLATFGLGSVAIRKWQRQCSPSLS